jgi:Helix-turn-helix domain
MRCCAIVVTIMLPAGALLIMTPANAQMSRDWRVCTGKVQAAQPDQQVAACTIIEAGQETPTNMAVAYCARGVAFHARDQLNRAIADYDESVMRNGVKMGPRFKLTEHQRGLAAKRLAAGESTRHIARDFNVSHNTIARLR